ncbi:MAG: SGNH/GDSL hydrolase family protein [Bdellovibrionaceae bacterium]|nr:SGNH/GDSL hydrolase family protein [Pseudobdellovibrionaceae bacterium]
MKLSTLLFISTICINSWAVQVLQIGDSHTVGAFGDQLYKSLSLNSNVTSARSIGLASASGSHYSAESAAQRTLNYGFIDRPYMKSSSTKGTVDKLSTLLNNMKPDVLIVELADNFSGYRTQSNDIFAKNEIQKILNQISTSNSKPNECFWVGPTWTDWVDDNGLPVDKRKNNKATFYKKSTLRAQQIANLIKKEIDGKCTFIDSMKIMAKSEVKTADGIHCNQASGVLWGQRVYEEITGRSTLLGGISKMKPAGPPPTKKNK